jgi:chromosomal replication initiation ATPase DnaA
LANATNILLFGPSGSGKSHLGAALGCALVENGYRVLFTRTTDMVQRLQSARQTLSLESALEKLDKYDLIILDDICYVRRDQAETSVLFELISARYERGSLLITSNQTFGEWASVFPDAAMTLAAVDRLVHHAVILEMNVESYRRRSAATRQKQRLASDSTRDTKAREEAILRVALHSSFTRATSSSARLSLASVTNSFSRPSIASALVAAGVIAVGPESRREPPALTGIPMMACGYERFLAMPDGLLPGICTSHCSAAGSGSL